MKPFEVQYFNEPSGWTTRVAVTGKNQNVLTFDFYLLLINLQMAGTKENLRTAL